MLPVERRRPEAVRAIVHAALRGPSLDTWEPPDWLYPHQREGARRIAGILDRFRGALLADAVGLGKTYVALAVAGRYGKAGVVAPAAIAPQWRRAALHLGVRITTTSTESLSRGRRIPAAGLIVVDEAHRFRNPGTRRYDRLARDVKDADLLLVTATPVVNRSADLVHLLRLFLPDHGLAPFGLPSLEHAAASRKDAELAWAAAPLVVARPPGALGGGPIPVTTDRSVCRLPPVAEADLERLLDLVDRLAFPDCGRREAAELLRRHLLYRFASSRAAFDETLRRHAAYLERAERAVIRGEPLSRFDARRRFGPEDDLQLAFDELWPTVGPAGIDPHALRAERARIQSIRRALAAADATEPKAERLHGLLAGRGRERRTIVFTGAIATARCLAQRLRWQRVVMVAGGRARIATGAVPLDEALAMFAPRARGVASVPRAQPVTTLIATDFASEGLDLQDADAVVHYDLPWTPLRLTQRVGRIARLGSLHTEALVHWFLPPLTLDRRIGLLDLLERKAGCQLRLGVTSTSRVGRTSVINDALGRAIARDAPCAAAGAERPRGFAVVRGPAVACAVIVWTDVPAPIKHVLVVAGDPPQPLADHRAVARALEVLDRGAPSAASPAAPLAAALADACKQRLSTANLGTVSGDARSLARLALRHARHAAKARRLDLLRMLDAVLDRLSRGIAVGAARALGGALHDSPEAVGCWLRDHPNRHPRPSIYVVEAVVFGDGTVPWR
jgi:superfamily II DNA or RNA helicase